MRDHSYTISQSGLRLLNGDLCQNVSNIINDTDGRGHFTHPHGKHFPKWVVVSFVLLVSPPAMLPLGARPSVSSDKRPDRIESCICTVQPVPRAQNCSVASNPSPYECLVCMDDALS